MKNARKTDCWNKTVKPILVITVIAILVAVLPLPTWGGSSDMCWRPGCHGAIYEEYTDLLPADNLSDLPTLFYVNYSQSVKIAVEITGYGSNPENISFFRIDSLMVNLTSANGSVIISAPNQVKHDIFPYGKVVFEWSVKGAIMGADTLTFDLYSNNTHENSTTWDYYAYDINIEYAPPSSPENLYGLGGDRFINISWEPPKIDGGQPVTGYNIYRNGTSGILTYVPGTQSWFNNTNLQNGLTYTYNVTAINSIGEGPNSTTIELIPSTAPSPPRSLDADSGDLFVHLIWSSPASDGGSPITFFTVYRGTSSGGISYLDSVDSLTFDYNDTSVVLGKDYYYYVKAMNITTEESSASNEIVIMQVGMSVPSHPLNLTAAPGDGNVSLTWEPPKNDGNSPLTEYVLERGFRSGEETFLITLVAGTTSYIDFSVINGLSFYYMIYANNSIGKSNPSNEAYATPQEGYGLPKVRSVSPDSNSINMTVGEVAAFYLDINDASTIIWYIDNKVYAKNVALITYTSSEPSMHTVRLLVTNETSTRFITKSWDLTYQAEETNQEGEDNATDVDGSEFIIPPEWNPVIVILGAVLLVIIAVIVVIIYFGKRKT